jgi:hypothetical protein
MWTETEDAFDGRDHPERRVSDIPTEEIHRVITGQFENEQTNIGTKM